MAESKDGKVDSERSLSQRTPGLNKKKDEISDEDQEKNEYQLGLEEN